MRAITTILALIGLATVLAHPQARKGAHALLEVGGHIAAALARKAPGGAVATVAVSSVTVVAADVVVSAEEDVAPELPGPESVEGDAAEPFDPQNAPETDVESDTSRVLKIYEDAERDEDSEG